MLLVQIVSLFWMSCLIMDMFNYTLITGVCDWYFRSTSEKRGRVTFCPGFRWAITKNLGSLAMGSAIILPMAIFRLIFGWFVKKLFEANYENCCIRCICCICSCCVNFCQRTINYIEERAYVQVALEGKSFCAGTEQALALSMKHVKEYRIIDGMGGLLEFLGKMTISLTNTGIAYLILMLAKKYTTDASSAMDDPLEVLCIVFVISYIMAYMFMSIFSITSMTLL